MRPPLAAPLAVVVALVLSLAGAAMAGAEELRQSKGQMASSDVFIEHRIDAAGGTGTNFVTPHWLASTSSGRAITMGGK